MNMQIRGAYREISVDLLFTSLFRNNVFSVNIHTIVPYDGALNIFGLFWQAVEVIFYFNACFLLFTVDYSSIKQD